jgi:MATE family multidrug resistance protein
MSLAVRTNSHTLSSYQPGSIQEVLVLFAPLILAIFSGSLMSFCDRLFASHYSLSSLKAVTAANYFCLFFQLGMTRITAVTQVFVGKSYGEKKTHLVGPYSWQMIWFSILSMAVTLPIGLKLIPFLFGVTEIAVEGSSYFKILMYGNFLFPLGVTLSAYFTGLGKTKVVGICSFGAQLVNVGLNYLLVFGKLPGFPPLGVRGAALGTIIAQGSLCSVLFILFLRENQDYKTHEWKISKSFFKEMVFLGFPRSLAKMWILATWNMSVRLITGLQGDYLLVLSIGSSIWLIYSPILQSLEQVLTTQVSFYRGKKTYALIWKSVRSSSVFVLVGFATLGIIFVFYLDSFLSLFIRESISSQSMGFIKLACVWLWIFFLLEGLNLVSFGLITGLGETWFGLKVSAATNLFTTYLSYYFAFQYWHCTPDKIWMLSWICMLISSPISFARSRWAVKRAILNDQKETDIQTVS